MYDFSEKVVVVTGAAKGLGYAMAQRFLDDGAKAVAILDLSENTAKEAAARLDPVGSRTLALACDVSDREAVASAFNQIASTLGPVDILINNAGATRDGFAHKMDAETFEFVIDVNLNSAFYCTRQVIPAMRERGWGRVIFLSSTAASGNLGQSNYSAAKAGLIGLTNTLSMELGGKGITVNCVAPGLIDTDILKTVPESYLNALLAKNPAGRLGKPEEVANLVAFLASDQAAYINGECIKICGGLR